MAHAFRLLFDGPIENLLENFVHLLEIRIVSAAAAPNVHPPIDEQFGAGLIDPSNARIAKKKRIENIEERKVRYGDTIRWCNLCRIESNRREPSTILLPRHPSLRDQQVKHQAKTRVIAWQRVQLHGSLREPFQNSAPASEPHGRAYPNAA